MDRWADEPPEEAYGRVTDAARFAPLHAVARELLTGLERSYAVQRDDDAVDPGLTEHLTATSVVRLTPADPGAAPLALALTDFPGLAVRFGRWHTETFPACGCDACAEQPDDVADDLRAKVAALVAGRFTEQLDRGLRPALRHAFTTDDGRSSGWSRLDRRRARTLGRPGRVDWRPWPPQPVEQPSCA